MKRWLAFSFILILSCGALAQSNEAAKDESFKSRLKQAIALYDLGRAADALPLFEDLVKQHPENVVVQEHYGMSMLMSSAGVTDPAERRRMRVEARKAFMKARELGDQSNLAKLADDIPEDGSFSALSEREDVNAALQAGEAAYGKGDYEQAIANYQKALSLDSKNHRAALYIGDVLFKQSKYDESAVWFKQAITIDPNRETAYRYWGDALKSQGKWEEAKEKFIDALVADPYNRNPWVGYSQWADARGMKLVKPNIVPPSKVEDTEKGANITIDSNSLGGGKDDVSGGAWLMYPMIHVTWKNQGEFLKKFPNEKQYRHSLAEEMAAFGGVLTVADELLGKKKPKALDPQIVKLQELRSKGLLEAYILVHRADEGIAQDYPSYRDAHRDKLQEYFASLLAPK